MPRGENVKRDLNRLANREKASPALRAKLVHMADTITDLSLTIRDFESAARFSDPRKVRSAIFGLAEEPANPPEWLTKPGKSKGSPGVPTLFASDWHFGEVVRSEEINGVNSYNLTIARKRARTMIESAIELLKVHMVRTDYPGIVFALGGDMVSGDIHAELKETNELPSLPTVLILRDTLVGCIDLLKEAFGKVFIPCVAGNHGRQSHKPQAKFRAHTNYDWLCYSLLESHYKDDPNVRFLVSEGPDAQYEIYGHRYLLTHGDQWRGGDGMIGALGPIIRGDIKKRARSRQIDMEYDTVLCGHWHQYCHLRRIIVNGSLIGYNEYAYMNNFGFEPPTQGLWVTHPKRGITFAMPVILEEKPIRSKEWVSF